RRAFCACPCLFFFPAEDGIRDRNVTGVQTCALPIYTSCIRCSIESSARLILVYVGSFHFFRSNTLSRAANISYMDMLALTTGDKIGRASCRERGEMSVGDGAYEQKNVRSEQAEKRAV